MGSLANGDEEPGAMAAVWETEDESVVRAAAMLPTPADTPYRTPSRSSRKSRRSVTPPALNPTPPPLPGEKTEKSSKRSSRDMATDESISILDPRRFTPTLHANLVSEILALRRDQEEKIKIIESLETSLHTTREEHETLQSTLQSTAKEGRSLKRQLALLEGGTSSALGELARERDEAIETAADAKKRLEASQKKLRSQEDDSQRVHDMWASEKDGWEEERRKYERKVHVAESRLKMLLDEVEAFQLQQQQQEALAAQAQNEAEDQAGNKDNDAASVRTMSITNSIRFSLMNGPGGGGMGRVNGGGHSLADELNFDGDDDYETDNGRGRDSVMSNHVPMQQQAPHRRNASRDSLMSLRTHRRNQSNESLMRPGSVARGRLMNAAVLERLERLEDVAIEEDEEGLKPYFPPSPPKPKYHARNSRPYTYTDSGVQFSPPPSPKLQATKPTKPVEPVEPVPESVVSPPPIPARAAMRTPEPVDIPPREQEVEANQRRKRIHIARPLTIASVVNHNVMVSASSQTVEPLSPPRTPKSPQKEELPLPPQIVVVQKPTPVMVSSSTQTDPPPPPVLSPALQLPPLPHMMQIPSISIHPPTSRPSTPREPRLPQLFKDFGCQVSLISAPVAVATASVQTEEIRVDKRLDRLPLHLHPSSITSRPGSPAVPEARTKPQASSSTAGEDDSQFAPGSLPPRNPRRLTSKRSLSDMATASAVGGAGGAATSAVSLAASLDDETHDAYPGNNDDGPLSSHKAPIRRPHRISSLFAGFDGGSSDEADEFADGDLSDAEYRTALSAPRPKSGAPISAKAAGKRVSNNPLSSSSATGTGSEAPAPPPKPTSGRSMVRSMGATETYSKFSLPAEGREKGDLPGVGVGIGLGSSGITTTTITAGGRRSSVLPTSGVAGGSSRASTALDKDKLPPLGHHRSSGMRRAAIIQSGIASHQGRARSPSLPQDPRDPPFPIPTRASSRRPVMATASAPSDGQRSPTRRYSGRSGHSRANSIRKVRSAAALPRGHPRYRGRQNSRSPPPPFSPSTEAPESPGLPPLPHNDITTPRNGGNNGNGNYGYAYHASNSNRYSGYGGGNNKRVSYHQSHPSADTESASAAGGFASSSVNGGGGGNGNPTVNGPSATQQQQATGVVDAIAQTMVGEWMFKYVRRRKSFGVGDGGGGVGGGGRDDSSNDRHKRWVWLAPYERAILWSSKQPVSSSALIGKSGRKLTIQSVLDVKDDNPPPKGAASQVFNRSILILTPQRALKFTATSSDRHYLWLTALSFLAHSSQAVPEILAAPPPLPSGPASKLSSALPDFELSQQQQAKPRRPGIRDSIRLAKGKTSFGGGGGGGGGGSSRGQMSVASSTQTDAPSLPSIPSYHQTRITAANRGATGGGGGRAESVVSSSAATTSHVGSGGAGGGSGGGPRSHPSSSLHTRDFSREAAEPPFIPRFHDRGSVMERANNVVVHGRKRSNTGGHVPPPLSFRGFSGPIGGVGGGGGGGSAPSAASSGGGGGGGYHHHGSTNSTAGASIDTTGSSGIFASQASSSNWGGSSSVGHHNNNYNQGVGGGYGGGGFASQRTSEASSRPSGAVMSNFFDAIGTVRMEAFISPLAHSSNTRGGGGGEGRGGGGGGGFFDEYPDEQEEMRYRARRRSKELRRRASRSRHRDSYNSRGTREEDFFRDDPFRGF